MHRPHASRRSEKRRTPGLARAALPILAVALLMVMALVGSTASAGERPAGKDALQAQALDRPPTVTWHEGATLKQAWSSPDEIAVFLGPTLTLTPADRRAIARSIDRGARIEQGSNAFVMFLALPGGARPALRRAAAIAEAHPAVISLSPVFYNDPELTSGPLALTGEVIVRFRDGASRQTGTAVAARHGLRGGRRLPQASRAYIYRAKGPMASIASANALAGRGDVEYAYPNWLSTATTRAWPTDPLFSSQWHLRNTGQNGGTAGEDLAIGNAITPIWDTYRGTTNEVVAVVDDGLELAHEDLTQNVLAGASWDYVASDADPTAGEHGTCCAGLVAARGFNGIGVSGVAPQAKMVGYRLLGALTDANEAAALTRNYGVVDVYSNSWGPADDRHLEAPGPLTQAALADGVAVGRGGKGVIYVWAAGNGGETDVDDNANFDGYANSRYVVCVSASDFNGDPVVYSESGACVMVNSPSLGDLASGADGIVTTDRTGGAGYAPGAYETYFNGTSASCPQVSGAVALMLQANPGLGWRDVQHILIETADQNCPGDADWATNGAGYLVNHRFGFGRVNVENAVTTAATWVNVTPEVSAQGSAVPALPIPDNNAAGVSSSITIAEDIKVEHVEVILTVPHTFWNDLRVELTSPDGTTSVLAEQSEQPRIGSSFDAWRFGSVRHFGESSQGTWTLTVKDLYALDVGTLQSWSIRTYGAADAVAPVTSDDADGLWHNETVTVHLTATDNDGGFGMSGGLAKTEYSTDGGTTWSEGTDVIYPIWKRGGGSGVHTLLYRSTDAVGNVEVTRSCEVLMDARPPLTTDDAPLTPQVSDVTVHFAAADSLFGVSACSGVKETWYSVDGGDWQQSTQVTITAAGNAGLHWIAYYSLDNAGNAEYVKSRGVTIAAP
jgi:kexin